MSTDICGEDVVVRSTSSPQIITTESVVSVRGVELGRKLLLAARAGDTTTVLELMAKGAPFTTDWLGTSPLHLAAANNHAETCAVLLRAGVSRDSRTKVERTPLHLAAAAGHHAVLALLLAHGAAPDPRDMLRMTPLHWAAARGHADAARCLLRHGADPRLRCKFRKTPRCLALRADRPDLVALLDEHEATQASAAPEQVSEVRPQPQRLFKRVDIKPQTKVKIHADKKIIIESKTQPIPASANVGRGASAAGVSAGTATGAAAGTAGAAAGPTAGAALLRAHGITLLPADRGSTVLTALRSGRTVVLSDAGKLMLKESSASASEPHIIINDTNTTNITNTTNANTLQANTTTNLSASVNTSAGSELSAKRVDSAAGNIAQGFGKIAKLKPAKLGKGVKLITLNKNLPLKRVIHPNDLQQVQQLQQVQLVRVAGRGRGALGVLPDAAQLQRLLARGRAATVQSQTSTPNYPVNEIIQDIDDSSTIDITIDEESPEPASSQDAQGSSLRAQLTAARAAVASLDAELRACRARLARYEGAQPQ